MATSLDDDPGTRHAPRKIGVIAPCGQVNASASIGLESWQGVARARRRDRRGIRPIVTLLEERTLLSQPGTWAAVAPLPTARVYLGAATGNDGTIYAVGGLVYGDGHTSEVDAYNPATNIWTKVAPLPWAGETSAVADHGLIYAISGNAAVDGNAGSVAAYNPQTNTWSAVASLPTARSNFAATVSSDGTIYVMGGSGTDGVTNEVDAYNPTTNSWTTVAPLPEPAAYITAAPGTDGVVYIIGDDTGNGTVTGATYAYSPNANTWSQVASVPLYSSPWGLEGTDAATTAPDGTIYAFSAGWANSQVSTYNQNTNTWTQVDSHLYGAYGKAATAGLDGTIYVMGGYATNYAAVSEVDAYTPIPVPVTPTVNVIDNGGTYNATAFVATATVNGQSNLEGVTPTLDYQQSINGAWKDLGATAPINAGSYDVTANFAGSADYTAVSSSTVGFTIIQAPLTITATFSTKTYDGTTTVTDGAKPTVTGLVGTDTITGLTESFTSSNAGFDPIQVNPDFVINDGNGGNNYAVTIVNKVPVILVGYINSAPLTVTVTSPTIVYGNTPTFVVTGSLPSGVTETTTIVNPIYSTSGHLDAGTYNLKTVLTGPLDNYTPNIVDGWLTVNDAHVTGSFTVANKTYDGTEHIYCDQHIAD